MVHGRDHGHHGLAVGKGQDGHLGTGEELLDDDTAAAFTENFVLQHGAQGIFGLLAGLGDDDALAQGQAVGLDDRGNGRVLDVRQRLFQVGEHRVGGGGDVVFLHQPLGKHLAALDDGGVFPGAEHGDAQLFQLIGTAQHQGVVGSHHGKADVMVFGEVHDAADVRGGDAGALGIGGDAAVAGQGVYFGDGGILFQALDDGVLTAAAAHNEQIHENSFFPLSGIERGRGPMMHRPFGDQ